MSDLLAAAQAGDGHAFQALVAPHLRALHLHSYRMLGSYDEAEEAVQEVLLRAWRSLHTYQGRAPLSHWLFRITTTTCLKAIGSRARRPAATAEITYLQPYPDRLLDQLTDRDGDPARVIERRETVALSFIVALQRLPASQRAALILRDVLAWSSAEVAELLEITVPAVNSLLQRARLTLRTVTGPAPPGPLSPRDRDVADRFLAAWQRCDVPALAALLREDAILRMPPEATVIQGRDQVAAFFATVPAGGRLDLIKLTQTRANGQSALAAYLPDDSGRCQGYGIMVLTVTGGMLSTITGFLGPGMFRHFGLVPNWDAARASLDIG
jgi:RNA polymerase sigma-70 factor (ECF subfamily)